MGLNKNNAGSKTAGKGFGKIQSMKWKYGNVVKVSAYGDDTGN
jgi:phosphotransferase system HPr-like phosphotransfer protein